MPLSEKEKKHYHQKFLALRKSLDLMESELGLKAPVRQRVKKFSFLDQLEKDAAAKTWSKPAELKVKNKKAVASTTA